MAYQAKRRTLYQEEFQLTEEDGTVVHTLQVSLDADNIARKLSEKHTALVKALQSVQKIDTSSPEADRAAGFAVLGNAVVDMLEAVFGEEDTKVIVEFYDSRYIEMCREVVPFITDIVIPEIRKIVQGNKKAVLSQYNRNWRRRFGKR